MHKLAMISVACLLLGVPLWLLVINSMKPLAEAQLLRLGLPHKWAISQNYGRVLHEGHTLQGFENSLIVTIPPIIVLVLLASMAGWVFARATTRAVRLMYYVFLGGILTPPAIVAMTLWLRRYHLLGGKLGLIAFYVGVLLPVVTFLVTGFVKTIPVEIEESAQIDGCSSFRMYRSIILPLLTPILVSVSIILFIFIWNDFFPPLLLLQFQHDYTLPLGLYNFYSANSQYEVNWHLVFADIVMVSLPLVIVYLIGQRWVISGVTQGSTKG